MTLSVKLQIFTFRAVITALACATITGNAQSPKATTAANQGAYSPNAQASPFNGKIVEERIAQVNGQIITSSDYQRSEQQMDAEGRQQGWSPDELTGHKRDMLRDLIDKELLLSKAKELNITGETELIKRLDEIRKQNHLESMEDLEKAAQQQGVSYEDFKQNIRNEIISQSVIRDQVGRKIQLTKADIGNYYAQHKSEFEQPESVHLSEILIPVAADDPSSLEKAQAKAADVEARLKAGGNFEELAKQNSSGPTAQTGGDLGEFKRGMLAKPLEDATFKLSSGETTAPIRTKQGLLVLKVVQHTGGSNQDYSAIQPQVEEAAFMDRMQPALRSYLTTLREQAYIDIRPGYKDSGASTNSVKPQYSAYSAPGSKKKAKVQRTRFRQAPHGFRSKSGQTENASAAKPGVAAPNAATGTAATTAATGTAATATASAPAGGAGPTGEATSAPGTTATAASQPPAKVAANTTSSKPVRKQKVRFGQAPTETLAATPGSSTVATTVTSTDAGAANGAPADSNQVASNVSSNVTQPGFEAAPAAAAPKTRFSYRAREPKQKKAATPDQLENKAVGEATPEERAAQQEQAAPLGLAGDTATKKKEPKPKSDHKTRYSEETKSSDSTQGETTASPALGTATTPPPSATKDSTGEPSPAGTLPEQTPPMSTAPATPATPPPAPQ